MKNEGKKGTSIYQQECKEYYTPVIRDAHSQVFTFDPSRIKAEKSANRYCDSNVEGIKNLYSFIEILKLLLKNQNNIKGIDYGCGSHYLVDDLRNQFGWDVKGYDVDAYAIELAKQHYPKNADNYIHHDLLAQGIPLPDNSQNFVFCNAVIQHFNDEEVDISFKEISRVLKTDGIFLIIFKRKVENWEALSQKTGLKIQSLNTNEGRIQIEDSSIKKILNKLPNKIKSSINTNLINGYRILHFYSNQTVIDFALKNKMDLCKKLYIDNRKINESVFCYLSGKKIPNSAIFLKKH